MLRLETLSADYGDALLLEYGPDGTARHRILIYGGPRTTYEAVRARLLRLPVNRSGRRPIDLLLMTHVDDDHIRPRRGAR